VQSIPLTFAHQEELVTDIDLRGLLPASVTPFTQNGEVDHEALSVHGRWLAGIDGVKGIVCNGHAGEGVSLTEQERLDVVRTLVDAVDGAVPIITGVVSDGSMVAALEARRCAEAGAAAVLLYPAHSWLRFGFQKGAPAERYRIVAEESGLPLILFQYPDVTTASYDLEEQLKIAALEAVVAIKNGVRNMRRWDTEIPVLRETCPDLQILTCHDEYLLHTIFDVDGALVGYGALAPELMLQLLDAGKRRDYPAARAVHDRLLPLTKAVYHRGSHMEGSVALKLGLVQRGVIPNAFVRSPLLDLAPEADSQIAAALQFAGLGKVQ
jgi:4-hydroxy-tetrahydrodipicolinate synthase